MVFMNATGKKAPSVIDAGGILPPRVAGASTRQVITYNKVFHIMFP